MNHLTPEKQIERLTEELHELREAVLNLVPKELGELLSTHHQYPHDDLYKWKNSVIAKTIEYAEPIASYYIEERALCPLCGKGSMSAHQPGFKLPEGLSRHLTGSSANKCAVMRTMERRAYRY